MKSIIVPIEFLKAIGEKPPIVRICWIKWLADYSEELFKPDFPSFFCDTMKEKNLNLETIKEAYNFGIVFFKDGFILKDKKESKKVYSEESLNLADEILSYLNERSNSTYTKNKANMDCIGARIKDGYTISDFKRVIDKKCQQWLGTEQQKYLRPITLFQASKFENYLNEPETLKHEPRKTSSIDKLSSASSKAKQYVNSFLPK
jgi:uncharacterized phage protein (TIGR02220 family)